MSQKIEELQQSVVGYARVVKQEAENIGNIVSDGSDEIALAFKKQTDMDIVANFGARAGGEFDVGITEPVLPIAGVSIDLAKANHYSLTVTGAVSLAVANVAPAGQVNSFTLYLTNAGNRVSFWADIHWHEGEAPELTAAGLDTLSFTTYDGGATWYGFVLGLNQIAA